MRSRLMKTLGALACALSLAGFGASHVAGAAEKTPTFAAYVVDPKGVALGQVTFVSVDGGVLVRADVRGLTPGSHGFHIHEVGSCNVLIDTAGKPTAFGAAGGHFDPKGSGHHLGPNNPAGHAGDFPNLVATDAGHARTTFFTDRLTVTPGPTNIVGRSIVVHANQDNYTDTPPNGGSGGRVACGEIGPLRAE